MWAACSVLLTQKDELCYWQRDLHMTFFIIICLRRTHVRFSQAQLPGWAVRGQVQKCNLQSSLSTPVNCHVVRGDFCLGDQTHISGCSRGTLSVILGFLRTCLMSRMNKSCHPRIILWVSWIRMSLELFKGLCVWALQSCPWSQRKPSNFTSASGPQPVDSKVIKHPLSSRFP